MAPRGLKVIKPGRRALHGSAPRPAEGYFTHFLAGEAPLRRLAGLKVIKPGRGALHGSALRSAETHSSTGGGRRSGSSRTECDINPGAGPRLKRCPALGQIVPKAGRGGGAGAVPCARLWGSKNSPTSCSTGQASLASHPITSGCSLDSRRENWTERESCDLWDGKLRQTVVAALRGRPRLNYLNLQLAHGHDSLISLC